MFLLFTIPNCPRCVEVKKLLIDKKIEFKEIDVTENNVNRDLAIKYNVLIGGTVIDDFTGEVIAI